MIKKILFPFLMILLVSCDPYDDRLTIINNTNQFLIIADRLWSADTSDYLKNKISVDCFEFDEYQVSPKSSKKLITNGSWDRSFVNNDTMVILIFNKKVILKKRTKKTTENYDIEQIIYVSHNYMEKNDWKIIIEPSKTSKIIKL